MNYELLIAIGIGGIVFLVILIVLVRENNTMAQELAELHNQNPQETK